MRSDAPWRLLAGAALGLLLLCGCPDEQGAGAPAPSRFAGVKKAAAQASASASAAFCEKSYPESGAQSRRYAPPPLRPLAGADAPPPPSGSWLWVNVWATWCTPCIEEMALMGRWRDGFAREGLPVAFELVSIDQTSAEKDLRGWLTRKVPGAIRWLRSEQDVGPFLGSLGVGSDYTIPIHALVDPAGQLRCVRVGAIHEQDWGAVKALVAPAR